MRHKLLAAVLSAASIGLTWPGAAQAALEDDNVVCQRAGLEEIRADLPAVLAACERALRAPDLAQPDRVQILAKRASLHAWDRSFAEAIADFSEILALEPDNAFAFAGRGNVYLIEGSMARAVADLDEAVRINPYFVAARSLRGLANFYLGDFGRAATDFRRAHKLELEDPYHVIWLYMANARSGRHARADGELRANAAELEADGWPAPVLGLFLGEVSVDEFLALAPAGDDKAARERRCEIYFYAAEDMMMSGNPELAADLFRATLETAVTNFKEYRAAQAELARLGE